MYPTRRISPSGDAGALGGQSPIIPASRRRSSCLLVCTSSRFPLGIRTRVYRVLAPGGHIRFGRTFVAHRQSMTSCAEAEIAATRLK